MYTTTDIWDTLGTNQQNITKDIVKWNLDDQGQRKKFAGRNAEQRAVTHEEHDETLQDLSDALGGELHAVALDPESIVEFHKRHNGQAIIDFYAPWCIWCQRLEPTWEKFARQVSDERINLGVGKVDCVTHAQLCKDQRVMAFPTLRWFENGKAVMPDYRGDRTVDALVDYAKRRVGSNEGSNDEEFEEDHHPGCLISGHLMVNRVPGRFQIEARSVNHELHSAMTNLTHRVHDLTFGALSGPPGHMLHVLPFFDTVPEKYKHTNPMQDKYYPTYEFHQAFHHHLKIISTHIDYLFSRSTVLYQILEQSQLVFYEEVNVPEIQFSFDLSPMSVNVSKEGRKWYEYVTSLCAIIGGTYTTLGLINATLLRIFKPKKL